MAKKKDRPKLKMMNQRKKDFMADPENNIHRLVSASKLKEFAKTIDPDIRMDKKVHRALVAQVANMIVKAISRCYDNKRGTIRPSDI
jgi:hypothetical protein